MRVIELAGLQLVWQFGGKIAEKGVFTTSDRKVLVLGSSKDDPHQAPNLGLVVQAHA